MKSFTFRLEKLLDVRRLKEDVAQRELAAAHAAVLERNRIILDLLTREDEARQDLRAMQERAIDIDRLRLAGEFLSSTERLLRREVETLQELVKTEIEKRRRLTEARKGVRVLERFRERKALLHRQGLDLEERKFLDEIGRRIA